MQTPIDVGDLADSVLLMRYFEAAGQVRMALWVLEERSWALNERTIREVELGKDGIVVGKPLEQFQGVLTGVPTFVGGADRGGSRRPMNEPDPIETERPVLVLADRQGRGQHAGGPRQCGNRLRRLPQRRGPMP